MEYHCNAVWVSGYLYCESLNRKNSADIFNQNLIAMKKNISIVSLLSGFAILLAGAFILSSCEGPAGAPGLDGENGVDGVDANETCIVCHNSDVVLIAKAQQTESSHHLEGGNYDRSHADCAICHTHQGFIETLESGDLEAAADIVNPMAINCRTCHMVHMNYDEGDWALQTTAAVDADFGDITIDLGGASNLCVNCHQFRPVSPMPEIGGGDVEITSSRWGPHHGPHGNNVWGAGGYMIAGSKPYPAAGTSKHAEIGCTACHMADQPYGAIASGGHTFNMTDGPDGSENTGACTVCHTSLEDFDYNEVQTTIAGLLADMEAIFVTKGWIDEPGDNWNTPITASADEAGAMLNYKIVAEDRSGGIHNPAYMIALLTNSLESLQ